MSAAPFAFDVVITLLLSGSLLWSYGDWLRQRVAVTVAVLTAWYFSFLIIFVLPLDVSNTTYKNCVGVDNATTAESPELVRLRGDVNKTVTAVNETATTVSPVTPKLPECSPPHSMLPEGTLLNLWKIVYWSSQMLTWLVLPLMQSYTQAGEFTAGGKLRSAIWDNAIYYASVLFIAVVLVCYIALQPKLHLNWEKVKAIAAAASNTWGLFVLVLMLGYGLVEVPRNCWYSAQRGYQLNRAYFKVAKLMSERADAEETLDDALLAVNLIAQTIGQADMRRPMVESILEKVPLEMMERVKRRRAEIPFGSDPPNEKTLIKMHRKVITALQNHHRTEAQWSDLTNRVFELEDINRNMISNEHVFKRTLSRPPHPLLARTIFNPTIEWYWKCLLSPLLLRAAAGVAAVMSVMVIWSEVTFFVADPPLSLFARFVSLARHSHSYGAMELVCFASICYLCLCTYYTIFKVRILNYYYLASNHQSDEYTLLFSGALLCRLTPPLCLNFLSLIHMDSHVIKSNHMETAYTQVMGHMDVVSIVSDGFNIYFPIALLGLSAATYFSLGSRLLTAVGFQQFLDQDSEVTQEMVEEGKEHIKREKRRIQRLIDSAARRREFAERFQDQESGGRGEIENRYRLGGIVKSRGGSNSLAATSPATGAVVTSPERSLLENQHQPSAESLPSPPRRAAGPPRNIFDDL